ncbi:MAG: glycosyltransferase [Candidatus Altiarchaeales archaeon]|nr:glycosyltransferase [Candidatus Altiarchaeales archaeon]MBD3416557.1 glycosyltransferase [Candidatus Altiarchaeales archaeon]
MLSVVIPVYNEVESIGPLHSQLKKVFDSMGSPYEIIFVDDGSDDGSYEALKSLSEMHEQVRVVKFRRNFGQTAAIDAGFTHASGSVIVSMDADLQNDPADIPRLLEKLDEGYDVVCGWRHQRHDPLSKTLPSAFANRLRKLLTGEEIHDSGCSLRAYTRESVSELELYGEMHRYIPSLLTWKGFKLGEVKVNHRPREHGKTKYSSGRLINGLFDLLFVKFWSDYSTRPLHFFGNFGVSQYLLAGLIFVEQIIKALIIGRLEAGPLLMLGILLTITGMLSIIFGFLSEIMIRAYFSGSKFKFYSVEEVLD